MCDFLLIGPRTNIKNPSKTGGAVVLFENLIENLEKQKVSYLLIDSNKENYKSNLFAYVLIFFQIMKSFFKVQHISLHSSRDYMFFAPIILILCKTFNKTCSLRKFGGEAYSCYSNAKGIKKKLLHFIFKNVDFLFLELKVLVDNFKTINQNTFWFPNVREKPFIKASKNNYSKKFIFISQVKYEKGIDEIVKAFLKLDDSFNIDIFGPIVDDRYTDGYFEKFSNISYKGSLNASDVLPTLNEYDVLLLPTFYEGEGYPGIIIESYSIAKPVISTRWKGIVEIVDENETGLLIDIKNNEQLIDAITSINEENYRLYSNAAFDKFKLFNAKEQTSLFLETILR